MDAWNKGDLKGKKFNRLFVTEESTERTNSKEVQWICKCDCGNIALVRTSCLKSGHTKSCGCLQSEVAKNEQTTHGLRYSQEYKSWAHAKKRCYNEKTASYKHYGGRGIKMCDRWLNSFENFYEDMGPKPSSEHSLDRYPNNETGNYEPGNCRWGTDEQQYRNRRSNRWFECNGMKMVLNDWAVYFGVSFATLHGHLKTKTIDHMFEYYKRKKIEKNAASTN